jgi:uracil-DNA glycosylase
VERPASSSAQQLQYVFSDHDLVPAFENVGSTVLVLGSVRAGWILTVSHSPLTQYAGTWQKLEHIITSRVDVLICLHSQERIAAYRRYILREHATT